ncbi:hypothetical protein CON65_17840 [Bacillus pseudomycoides]|uniref:Tyr recombinase domain-containing protein n=1 Tax=Bacillus pseudomycoides TaxID=64104 RepID=A0AA91VAB3_9BACI|nr:hypothetical protein COO03_23745 [Bacillus sp. AFS098217]PED81374.1 hypothetical protein CON65_17840 [Bacillus pseudomycoides]PEU08700.1 hypothetical protein CN525_25550 [Bacillus sp. AFS014408]PEU13482.1 hypothetical protein CN524_11500 [Bacillus sp. AFS019443]PFW61997.1 hypothetical protein COL20_15060 [Bacillus sp. AFS075034]
MRVLSEIKGSLGNFYELSINGVSFRKIKIVRVSREYKGYYYLFLLNSQGKIIQSVFDFLNEYCRNETVNSREQSTTALKFLYSFVEILDKKIEDFDSRDIQNFSCFLQGNNSTGNFLTCKFISQRSISTHNQYFDMIRKYLRYIGIKEGGFFEKKVVSKERGGYGMLAHTQEVKLEKYRTNKSRHSSFAQYVPKYISSEDYKKIMSHLKVRNSKHNLRDSIIINLMYTRGLRLGEVLGLTLEDITEHPDNNEASLLYIRNRVSDKKYQCAKGCMKVTTKEDYATKAYQEENRGYQTVAIPPDLKRELQQYTNLSRDIFELSTKKIKNMMNGSKADSVVSNSNINNYYLFLNKNGTPLSSAGWSKILKEIFRAVKLDIDREVRKNNLSHRFRHGYAMFLIEKLKKDISYVKCQMRHRSLQSTMKYFNPTREKILEESMKIQEKIKNNL